MLYIATLFYLTRARTLGFPISYLGSILTDSFMNPKLTNPEKRLLAAILRMPAITTSEGKQINSRKLRAIDPSYHRPKGKLCDKGILFVYEDYSPGVYSQRYLIDVDAISPKEIIETSVNAPIRVSDPGCEEQLESMSGITIDIDAAIEAVYEHNSVENIAARIGAVEVIDDKLYCAGELIKRNSVRAIELSKETGLEAGRRFFIGKNKIKEYLEETDVFTFTNNKSKPRVIIGNKKRFIERKRNEIIMSTLSILSEVYHKMWWVKISDTNGREFNTLTNLPNYLWDFLRINGKPFGSIDMSNADVLAWLFTSMIDEEELSSFLSKPSKRPLPYFTPSFPLFLSHSLYTLSVRQDIPEDLEAFKNAAISGDVYMESVRLSGMEETKENRSKMKTTYLAMGYDIKRDNEMNRLFESMYPTVKRTIDRFKEMTSNKIFATTMQSIVSTAWSATLARVRKMYPSVNRHDEVKCAFDEIPEVRLILEEELLKYFPNGFNLKTKIHGTVK